MAIVTVLAIETDIHGYRDRLGHRNRHSWLLWPSWPSKPIFIIPKLNRVSSARKLFESSLRGTVYISLINAEVAKTITSLLCCCFFLPWDTLSHSDLSYYSWNKWYDLSPCEPCWKRWEHGHRRLGWSLSRLARDLSDAASFSPSKSFSQRSCHSRTVRNVDARSVGACPEDAKRKIRRTCLKDPGLTHVTWSRWYKPDGYLVGNADLSRGYLRLIAATSLPLHWRLSQQPPLRSLVPGLVHLTLPRWKVSGLPGSIKSWSSLLELQRDQTLRGPLASAPGGLPSRRLPLAGAGSPSWSFSNRCRQRLVSYPGCGGGTPWTCPT